MKQSTLALIAAGMFATGACSGSSDSSTSSTLTAPTGVLATENFTGTVQVASYDANPFTVTSAGSAVNLTLTTAGPPSTIYMGFGVGSYVGATCTLLSGGFNVFQAGTVPQLSGMIAAGPYCVMVYDAGNMTAPITYTVTVTHY